MKGKLTPSQKQYVLDHLEHHAFISDELKSRFCFDDLTDTGLPYIRFWESNQEFDQEKVIRIDDIPVLYPSPKSTNPFYGIQDSTLVFYHDLLKSAFHLLSGYDEYINEARDQYGRFPFRESIQYKLGIVSKPVVNYYFDIILEGLEEFCKLHNIPFERRPVFTNPVLFLSHDIDHIDAYRFYETAFKFKQLLGLAPSPYSREDTFKSAFSALYYFLNPFSKKNPFWNFDYLHLIESERGFRSTYFFLEKDGKHENSRYRFSEKRIIELFRELSGRGDEIGLHGTIRSATSLKAMERTLDNLKASAPESVVGVRQHYLKFSSLKTAIIQQSAGLKYDATLGFAEHEGFRNSYCWPFRFYDFRTDQSLELWEIPLTVMEVTLFYYRELDLESAMQSIQNLAAEVVKFNGIFSLLWHNSFFDEKEFPGITSLYISSLNHFKSLDMEGLTGREIIMRFNKID